MKDRSRIVYISLLLATLGIIHFHCFLPNCKQLLKAQPSDDIQSSHTDQWEELYSPPPGHVIQDMDVFASHCVLALQVDNIPQLAIVQHSGEMEPLHIEVTFG